MPNQNIKTMQYQGQSNIIFCKGRGVIMLQKTKQQEIAIFFAYLLARERNKQVRFCLMIAGLCSV